MLYSYAECLEKYKTGYRIKQAIERDDLFKLSPGVYSDVKNVSGESIIVKKYPKAVFTLNSAFYYQGLTDTIPSYYYLLTDKDSAKISQKDIKQSFDNNDSLNLGLEIINYNGEDIPVFSKERLLIELIRNKYKLPFDYYKEIIGKYRDLIYSIDFQLVEEYAEKLPKTKMIIDTIQSEVL